MNGNKSRLAYRWPPLYLVTLSISPSLTQAKHTHTHNRGGYTSRLHPRSRHAHEVSAVGGSPTCSLAARHCSFQHAFVMAASLSSARRVPRSLLPENTVLHSAPVHVHICRHAEVAPFCCVGACPALPSCVVHDAPAKPHRPLLLHAL